MGCLTEARKLVTRFRAWSRSCLFSDVTRLGRQSSREVVHAGMDQPVAMWKTENDTTMASVVPQGPQQPQTFAAEQ
jgi:hypothetical protein